MKTARFTESQIISISMAGGLLQVIAFGTVLSAWIAAACRLPPPRDKFDAPIKSPQMHLRAFFLGKQKVLILQGKDDVSTQRLPRWTASVPP
jgi:hypothetical protein